MARLNEPGGIGGGGGAGGAGENVEVLKRRFLRQNREIAKANSVQSARIRKLEYDLQVQLMQNMELRKEITMLKAEVDRRDAAKEVVGNIGSAKRGLEKKLSEMMELLGTLEINVKKPSERRKSRAEIEEARKSKEEREAEYAELINAGYQMPVIFEDAETRSRRSLHHGDFPTLSPNYSENDADIAFVDQENERQISPPLQSMIDTRPRRRRDSYRLSMEDLEPSVEHNRSPVRPEPEEPPIKTRKLSSTSTSKRKYEELPDYEIQPPRVSSEFEFISAKNPQLSKLSSDALIETSTPPDVPMRPSSPVKEVSHSPPPAKRRPTPLAALDPPQLTTNTTSTRKALGPKGANFSPVKTLPIKPVSEKPLKPEKSTPIKQITTPTRNANTASDDSRPRRTRGAASSVNYALPSLRMKLRRENEELVDAVTGERKGVFTFTAGGSATSTPASTRPVRVKDEDIEAGETLKAWRDIPETRPVLEVGEDRQEAPGVRDKADRKSSTELVLEAARERRRKRLSGGLGAPIGQTASHSDSSSASTSPDNDTSSKTVPAATDRRRRQTFTLEPQISSGTTSAPATKISSRRRSTAV